MSSSQRERLRERKARGTARAEIAASLPNRFEPKFWAEQDGRRAIVREVRRRVARLKADCGADSEQKILLCERAAFLSIQLEYLELQAAETGQHDAGIYTQSVNALSGLLSKLGLENQSQKVLDLKAYVAQPAQRKQASGGGRRA